MMIDEILKDNWMYQRMLEEGRKEGIEKGIKKGLEEGRKEGIEKGIEEGIEKGRIAEARQNIELFVEKRFPSLLSWVQVRIEQISDADTLQQIISALFADNTAEDITAAFAVYR